MCPKASVCVCVFCVQKNTMEQALIMYSFLNPFDYWVKWKRIKKDFMLLLSQCEYFYY